MFHLPGPVRKSARSKLGDTYRHACTANPRLRQVFHLCDGVRTLSDLHQTIPPRSLTSALNELCRLGLVIPTSEDARPA